MLLILMFSNCIPNLKVNRDSTQIKPLAPTENIVFVKSWKRFDHDNTMRLYDYLIKRGQEEINGLPCIGRFTLDSLGRLYGGTFARDAIHNGSMIPAGSRLESFNVDTLGHTRGYMIFLSEPCMLQGLPVRDKDKFWSEYKVTFYKGGQLNTFKLYQGAQISGFNCSAEVDHGVRLYPDSSLLSCHLAKDTTIADRLFKQGAEILINPDGSIESYSDKRVVEIYREMEK